MVICPIMSQPVVVPNKYGSPAAKLIEVECRETACQLWYDPPKFCRRAINCPDVDSGPCGESCPNADFHPIEKGCCELIR